jgi:hypothetical protein
MAVSLEQIERVAASTLPKFLARPGEKLTLVNEAADHDYVVGRLFKRIRMSVGEGSELKWPLQFERANVTTWGHAHSEITLGNTKPARWGKAPWRMLLWGWYLPYAEMHANRGIKEVLYDLGRQCREDVAVALCGDLEDAILAEDGNYAHDGTGPDNVIPYGLLQYGTIDGLHIAEAGAATPARSVADINPGTYTRWKNPFISPVASTDGLGTITSIWQFRQALNRMMRLMRFDSISAAWGNLAEGVRNAPDEDPDRKETPEDLMILTDDKTEVAYREVLFSRQEDIGYDQFQERPAYKRLKLLGTDKLRMNAQGYGKAADGSALWTDRGGSYASGQWAGWGRALVLNTRYLHVAVHPEHGPLQKKPYVPERRMGLAHEGDLWLQLICRSRRRGIGHIGPFNTDLQAA